MVAPLVGKRKDFRASQQHMRTRRGMSSQGSSHNDLRAKTYSNETVALGILAVRKTLGCREGHFLRL